MLTISSEKHIKHVPTTGHVPLLVNTTHRVGYITAQNTAVSNTSMFISLPELAPRILPVLDECMFDTLGVVDVITNIDSLFVSHFWSEVVIQTIRSNALLRMVSKKVVYMVQDGTRHAFHNLAAFTSRGFDFDQVVVISDPLVYVLLPVGNELVAL